MKKNNHPHNFYLPAFLMLAPMASFAGNDAPASLFPYFSNALFNTLLVIIIILAVMVTVLSRALKNVIGSDFFTEKIKKEKQADGTLSKLMGLIALLFLSVNAYSQDQLQQVAADDRIGGLDQATFYTMLVIIFIEFGTLGILFNIFRNILNTDQPRPATHEAAARPATKNILDKINDTVDIENEGSILLDHDYDGIKELDNNLPPWWKYGFYLTILVAVVYMVNYHIIKTSPLQAEEYTNSIKKAEKEIAAFMLTSASNVDESTVKLLVDPADLNAGKDIFISNCAACHGKYGEGSVGPNLTDDYWLHAGGIKDIFKTIKYGWPDKGMKAWKDDFSPVQIAQLTSYIKTLRGTNPQKPKDRQGELYREEAGTADPASVIVDSLNIQALEITATK